jgi:hypothetical protein
MEKVTDLESHLTRVEGRIAEEFSHAGTQRNFLVICARFVVTEVLICRLLLRDYVHTAYKKLVEGVGRPVKEVEANFHSRVLKYRAEAEATLNDLTEDTVKDLHDLADSEDGFRDR